MPDTLPRSAEDYHRDCHLTAYLLADFSCANSASAILNTADYAAYERSNDSPDFASAERRLRSMFLAEILRCFALRHSPISVSLSLLIRMYRLRPPASIVIFRLLINARMR